MTMQRVLLKLSGEALGGEQGTGLEPSILSALTGEVSGLLDAGVEVAIVLGGGNLFRGAALSDAGMDRVVGDRMGMLATVMNGLAMADFLGRSGINAKVFSAFAMAGIAPGYNRDEVATHLAAGGVAVLAGGTGNPFFTTDTAACLRGIELGVDAVLKATKVDGVYDKDPMRHQDAQKFDRISYDEVLARGLGVMDLTAIVLCQEHNMPIVVFDMGASGALAEIAKGGKVGTVVERADA